MILDEKQREAVTSTHEHIIVSAGAGSGKTRVLTERIRHLINNGVEAHNIVAITFTNMAADEMHKRLSDIPTIGDAFVGTIHSFANKIYKVKDAPYIILDDDVNQTLMKEVLLNKKYEALTYDRWLKYMDMVQLVELGKIEQENLSNFLLPSERNVLNNCTADYNATKKKYNVITFDELLGYAIEYYKSMEATIEHVLVDELQDVGRLEYNFITGLNANNYFLIGDDWQAIYGWKGGNVEIFNSLLKDKKYKTFNLEINYRNCKKVIELGNRILNQVGNRSTRKVVGVNKSQGIVNIQPKTNIYGIAKLLKADPKTLGDWFVLTRTNAEANKLAEIFTQNKIKFILIRKSEMTLEQLETVMKDNVVKLLTVHSAKGLENKKVIMYGSFPINVPSYRTNKEERLVAYVGVTRAINELHLFN